jgi:hypothetical protein
MLLTRDLDAALIIKVIHDQILMKDSFLDSVAKNTLAGKNDSKLYFRTQGKSFDLKRLLVYF